ASSLSSTGTYGCRPPSASAGSPRCPGTPDRRSSMSIASSLPRRPAFVDPLNGARHPAALTGFMVVVLAHWAEPIAHADPFWILAWPRPQARGVLGMPFPWLVTSEWLHYGYALVMLIGLFLLRPGFVGRARTWWTVALVIQFWHHVEHLLLLL